jgi:hypothetical protein
MLAATLSRSFAALKSPCAASKSNHM